MPQVGDATSIAANSTTNVMSGRLFERVGGRGAQLKAYAVQLTGAVGAVQATFIAGSDVITQEQGLVLRAGGRQIPEDSVGAGVGLPGDQILLNLINTTGAAIIVSWLVDITNA